MCKVYEPKNKKFTWPYGDFNPYLLPYPLSHALHTRWINIHCSCRCHHFFFPKGGLFWMHKFATLIGHNEGIIYPLRNRLKVILQHDYLPLNDSVNNSQKWVLHIMSSNEKQPRIHTKELHKITLPQDLVHNRIFFLSIIIRSKSFFLSTHFVTQKTTFGTVQKWSSRPLLDSPKGNLDISILLDVA